MSLILPQEKVSTVPSWYMGACSVVVFLACAHVWHFTAVAEAGLTADQGYTLAERIVIVAAGILLLVSLIIDARRPAGWRTYAVAGAACGALGFVKLVGFALLDPSQVHWLVGDDWQQHYYGWAFFRQDSWHWPPGVDTRFLYPVGTSIMFTDSYPLFAIPFKLFREWLPATFQYIGIALGMHWLLQGVFSALLARAAGMRLVPAVLVAMLVLSWPVFFQRMHQEALNGQWLLLAGLTVYIAQMRDMSDHCQPPAAAGRIPGRRFLAWVALLAIAALTHPYLGVMVFGLYIAFELLTIELSVPAAWPPRLIRIGALAGLVLVLWYLAGGFIIRSADLGATRLGFYSANLLTFIDPGRFSDWRAPLPRATAGQQSGFGYFGTGLGLVLLLGLAHGFNAGRMHRTWWPLALVATGAAAFAISPKVTFGSQVLFDLSAYALHVLDIFRASGRFIWLPAYCLLAFACTRLARLDGSTVMIVLIVALGLQTMEFDTLSRQKAALRAIGPHARQSRGLDDERWAALAQGRQHLVLVPSPACSGGAGLRYEPFAALALRHRMTLNAGYVARSDTQAVAAYCRNLEEAARRGAFTADSLYVMALETPATVAARNRLACEPLDGLMACVVRD